MAKNQQQVYVNGSFLPAEQATVSVFDRGFLMADAVYEVTPVLEGALIEFPAHLFRLSRSLKELDLPNPLCEEEWRRLHLDLVKRNRLENGLVYVQVTRGAPLERDFLFPSAEAASPAVVAFTQSRPHPREDPRLTQGVRVLTCPDLRWGRCDIKSTQLLYSSWRKSRAVEAGADDVWFEREGVITEGSSNNAFIVKNGDVLTHPETESILCGVTRTAVLRLIPDLGLALRERAFTVEEAQSAEEAFITSATTFVLPVTELNGEPVGNGKPGPVSVRLREMLFREAHRTIPE